jgi:hypothetical protein
MEVARLSALSTSQYYTQEISLVLISLTGWIDPMATVPPEGLCQSMTPAGIETLQMCWVKM